MQLSNKNVVFINVLHFETDLSISQKISSIKYIPKEIVYCYSFNRHIVLIIFIKNKNESFILITHLKIMMNYYTKMIPVI
jgi:hypothetical protein